MSFVNIPKIEAASLVAVPAPLSSTSSWDEATFISTQLCDEILENKPFFSHTWENTYGKTAVIFIPAVDVLLFRDKNKTLKATMQGIEMAISLGAKSISFTGMIPAATGFITSLAKNFDNDLILTTGHAAVVAAFALNTDLVLEKLNRKYEGENVAFIGLGSIGEGILKLLSSKKEPKKIFLVDVEKKIDHLKTPYYFTYFFIDSIIYIM